MTFAAAVDRVRSDFTEMPRLELSLPQAIRLWSLGMDDCRSVVDALVDAGFLRWTGQRTIVRNGRVAGDRGDILSDDVSVGVLVARRRNVGK
jgi:hypothetical protein